MKTSILSAAATLMLSALLTVPCRAGTTTISTADGRGADVSVSRFVGADNTASQNAGAAPQINSKTRGRKIYLRFDLSKLPAGKIKSARLVLTTSNFTSLTVETIHRVYGINDGAQGDGETDWLEKEITWDNAPQNSGTDLVGPDAELIGEMEFKPTAAKGEKAVFTMHLADFLRKDHNHLVTLVLLRTAPESADVLTIFSSKEDPKGEAPKLEIETGE